VAADSTRGSTLPSLFVVSLPRSCSGLIYFLARRALGLTEPSWTTEGEILNVERLVHAAGSRDGASVMFTTADRDAGVFDRLGAFLDQVVQPTGFAYKDVVQPFLMSAWLARQPVRVLRIQRPVADVAFSTLTRGWCYPENAATRAGDREGAVVEGLLRAEGALGAIPAETLRYDDFLTDERHLHRCLARLYPEVDVEPIAYMGPNFNQEKYRQLARRATPRHHQLAAVADDLVLALRQ
jgi:hypothetical protein